MRRSCDRLGRIGSSSIQSLTLARTIMRHFSLPGSRSCSDVCKTAFLFLSAFPLCLLLRFEFSRQLGPRSSYLTMRPRAQHIHCQTRRPIHHHLSLSLRFDARFTDTSLSHEDTTLHLHRRRYNKTIHSSPIMFSSPHPTTETHYNHTANVQHPP